MEKNNILKSNIKEILKSIKMSNVGLFTTNISGGYFGPKGGVAKCFVLSIRNLLDDFDEEQIKALVKIGLSKDFPKDGYELDRIIFDSCNKEKTKK